MADANVQAAIWAAAIAAGATVSGYLLNQSRSRRERKATVFAEALTALRRYQDFPYKIWRRPAEDAQTRMLMADEQSEASRQVRFHLVWLQIDSPIVGEAFSALWRISQPARLANLDLAWQSGPITQDAQMAGPLPFQPEAAEPEMDLCITAMRSELSLLAPLHRRRIRRLLSEQSDRRAIQP